MSDGVVTLTSSRCWSWSIGTSTGQSSWSFCNQRGKWRDRFFTTDCEGIKGADLQDEALYSLFLKKLTVTNWKAVRIGWMSTTKKTRLVFSLTDWLKEDVSAGSNVHILTYLYAFGKIQLDLCVTSKRYVYKSRLKRRIVCFSGSYGEVTRVERTLPSIVVQHIRRENARCVQERYPLAAENQKLSWNLRIWTTKYTYIRLIYADSFPHDVKQQIDVTKLLVKFYHKNANHTGRANFILVQLSQTCHNRRS